MDRCPASTGDGLCVARDAVGASSGGIPLSTVLIVAYDPKAIFGEDYTKVRIDTAHVLDVVDVAGLAREANLSGANLRGADLSGANLYRADLSGAKGRTDWDVLVSRGAIR